MLLVALVHADDKETRKAAEREFRIAEKAYQRQNFAAAAEHFEEAFKLLPIPEIAFSAAQAYRRQYRVDQRLELALRAAELYKIYLAQMKSGARVGDAVDYLDGLEREIARRREQGAAVTKPAPVEAVERTTLVINPELTAEPTSKVLSEVADTEQDVTNIVVSLDGKPVAPFEKLDVEPGPHKIHVEADGYVAADVTERAVKGVSVIANVTLTPKPASVKINTEAGARIRVDGRPIEGGAKDAIELPAGRHVIAISRRGREPIARELIALRGQQLELDEPLEKTTQRKVVPWVAGAAGVLTIFTAASITGAVVFDRRAADQHEAFLTSGDRTLDDAAAYRDTLRRRREFVVGAWVGAGATILVAGTAAALYWLDSPSDEGVRVTPALVSGGGGVTLGGAF